MHAYMDGCVKAHKEREKKNGKCIQKVSAHIYWLKILVIRKG